MNSLNQGLRITSLKIPTIRVLAQSDRDLRTVLGFQAIKVLNVGTRKDLEPFHPVSLPMQKSPVSS